MSWYRVTVDGIGIYEAVDRDCPKDSKLRDGKPDGSWLPKTGLKHLKAIAYWTEYGWKKYNESGLFEWHKSVVEGQVDVEIREERPEVVLEEDTYQIIISSI